MALNFDQDNPNVVLLAQDSIGNIQYGTAPESPSARKVAGHGLSENSVGFYKVSFKPIEHKFSFKLSDFGFKKLPPKTILDDLSGIMRIGLNAIMGPADSRMSSLLDVLADHAQKKGQSGQVFINGENQPINYCFESAYVMKEDVLTESLTVRENIAFSASLRLSCSKEQRREKVNQVIRELELTDVADRKVSVPFTKKISEEERRRTNIGLELVIDSGILFLEEPTGELADPNALSLVNTLKNLSSSRVVVASFRRAQFSIYKQFDTLTLLSRGGLLYHGQAGDTALKYFIDIGHQCEPHDNPVDHFLKVINEVESKETENFTTEVQRTKNLVSVVGDAELGYQENKLVPIYKESTQHQDIDRELTLMLDKAGNTKAKTPEFAVNFVRQLSVLSYYLMKGYVNNPMSLLLETIVYTILGIVIGLLYFQVDDNYAGFQNRVGVLFFIAFLIMFGSLSGVSFVKRGRPIFLHHVARGYYRVSTFHLTKLFCDLPPPKFIFSFLFGSITYWLIGLKPAYDKFIAYLLMVMCMSWVGGILALNNSAGQKSYPVALGFSVGFTVLSMVVGGFLINNESIGTFFKILQFTSPFRFMLHAFFVSELEQTVYCDLTVQNRTINETTMEVLACDPHRLVDGDAYLDSIGYRGSDLWVDFFSVFMTALFPGILIYLTLLFFRCFVRRK